MAQLATDVFDEHLSVIAALRDNYVRKDDAAAVLGIQRVQQEIAQLCSGREEHVKQSIRGECAAGGPAGLGARGGPRLAPHGAGPASPAPPAVAAGAELSERVQEAEARATYPEAEAAHEGRVNELTGAAEEANENVNRLNEELR